MTAAALDAVVLAWSGAALLSGGAALIIVETLRDRPSVGTVLTGIATGLAGVLTLWIALVTA